MKKIIYVKYSNERAVQYAIRTDILMDESGRRYVQKRACYPEGAAHVENIFRYYHKLEEQYKDTPIIMNCCIPVEEGVQLEYLQGSTMEEQLDTLLFLKEYEQAEKIIICYLSEIQKAGSSRKFQVTREFQQVFGAAALPEGLACASVTNVDMLFSNLIVNEVWNLIDYEWTYDFPIPVNYVIYRVLHYYMDVSDKRKHIKSMNLYERFEISKEQIVQYERMEQHFQKHIELGHQPIRDLYQDITPGKLFIGELVSNEKARRRKDQLQMFYAAEEDFSDEKSIYYQMNQGKIKLVINIPEGTDKIRLDPGEQAGILYVNKIRFITDKGEGVCVYTTNGIKESDGKILFEIDPQLYILEIPDTAKGLEIDITMEIVPEQTMMLIKQFSAMREIQIKQIRELEEHLVAKERLIRQMENTKIWRAYRKVRGEDRKGKQ